MTKHFTIFPGDPRSNVIIHVPHAGVSIPEDARESIVLSDADLKHEILTMADTNTDLLAMDAYKRANIRPHVFLNNLSRLVIDPERFIDGTEEMDKVGMGAVYTRTHDGRELRPHNNSYDALIDKYFISYTQSLSELANTVFNRCGSVKFIDLHSYSTGCLPYELHQSDLRPELCIGTDKFHTNDMITTLVKISFDHFEDISINQPFKGTYVPLEFYQFDARVQSVMLEIRKDAYSAGEPASPKFIATQNAILAFVSSLTQNHSDS